ncbi:alpha/beta hydrolase, partial [cyanobacterium TDX16]
LGAAGVAIDSAPTEGVHVSPPSQIKSLFPALKNPANHHRAVGFTAEQFHYAFANTLSEEDSKAVWERYAIPAPGRWVFDYGLFANLTPGHQETWVDYKADRAPLLFIAGSEDHIMPPSVNRSNAKHYKHSPAVTEIVELEGRDHWTCGAPGWEAVADQALEWALANAS